MYKGNQKGKNNNNFKGGKPKCINCGKKICYGSVRCKECYYKLREKDTSNFKNGKYCKDRKNNCLDCGTEISKHAKRCRKCADQNHSKIMKSKMKIKWQQYYCIDCGKKIKIGAERCKRCYNEFRKKKDLKCICCGEKTTYGSKLGRCQKCYFGTLEKEGNPNWKDGKSFELYPEEFNNPLKELIRDRDGHKCRLCGCPEIECLRKLSIHHIDYDKKNCNPDNLISLCQSCNSRVNNNRKYWEKHFATLMEKRYALERNSQFGK